MSKRPLWILIALLLLQLFLRAHQITRLPVFIDEDNHIRRAAEVHAGKHHPAKDSHGKFLLYLWLAVADLKERPTALHLARTLIALASLVTTAGIFAITRRLFKVQVALLAALLYALMPFAFFFERMALADPLAGALGIVAAWQSVRLAQAPTRRGAVLTGICVALAVAAKLTMAFAVLFPVMAVLLLGSYADWREMLRRYFPKLVLAGVVVILLWLPVLIPARISLITDAEDYILLNMELTEKESPPLIDKLARVWERLTLLTGLPMAVILVIGGLYLLYRMPRRMGYLFLCLMLTWLPTILFSPTAQSRYLMAGVPYIAILLGSILWSVAFPRYPDAIGTGRDVSRHHPQTWALGGIILLWAGLFALPFAYLNMTDPAALTLPATDENNYFWDRYNGYGTLDGLVYLRDEIAGEKSVAILVTTCRQFDYYDSPEVHQICLYQFDSRDPSPRNWRPAIEQILASGVPLYALTDEWTIFDPELIWEHIAVFPKPEGRQVITLWRISAPE